MAKYLDRVYSPDRLLYPMRRKAGVPKGPLPQGREAEAFERITWDEALDEIAARLKQIAAEHGPESILPYSYAGTIGQLGYGSMDRRFFHRLGASQLDRTICSSAGGAALLSVYGVKLGTPPEDFAHAGLIIAWGANIHGNNIHLWPFIEEARRHGARLIVIDPYKTRTAALADEHLAIHPGTDAALALGLMHVILREGLEDRAVHRELRPWLRRAEGPRAQARVRARSRRQDHGHRRRDDRAARARLRSCWAQRPQTCGDPAELRHSAQRERRHRRASSRDAPAAHRLHGSTARRRPAAFDLGLLSVQREALQMPELMQASPLGRPARDVNMSTLGQALTLPDAGVGGPPVKALFVYNSNPAAIAPNQNDVLRGMGRDDLFTVVHEQFFTDTADYADYRSTGPDLP